MWGLTIERGRAVNVNIRFSVISLKGDETEVRVVTAIFLLWYQTQTWRWSLECDLKCYDCIILWLVITIVQKVHIALVWTEGKRGTNCWVWARRNDFHLMFVPRLPWSNSSYSFNTLSALGGWRDEPDLGSFWAPQAWRVPFFRGLSGVGSSFNLNVFNLVPTYWFRQLKSLVQWCIRPPAMYSNSNSNSTS